MPINESSHPTSRKTPTTTVTITTDWLYSKIVEIEEHSGMDALTVYGPIMPPADLNIRLTLDRAPDHRERLLVILDTPGGIVEVAERIASTLRHYYREVTFAIPDSAMSAGTVLVMSGDAILMDHFSRLGPIDPQLHIKDKPIPTSVLSYLEQFERLVSKSKEGTLTTAELLLLQKLDLADLRQYELAAELSIRLIRDWLAQYKFKDWSCHSSTGQTVTMQEKLDRGEEIARALNDQQRWGTHNRGIDRDTLSALKLRIDDLEADPTLSGLVREYFWFLRDFALRNQVSRLVHNRYS